jgi:hypothetical protein
MYAYSVSYSVYENEEVYKTGTLGVKHNKKCTPTDFKKYIKSILPASKKRLPIVIAQVENISEEECDQRFGNETFNPK